MPRHFLRDDDLSPAEQAAVLDLADVWTSMGQEGQEAARAAALGPYQLDEEKPAGGPGGSSPRTSRSPS